MADAAIRPGRLFFGSCTAVTALAFTFAAMSAVMYQLKTAFLLDNAQVGLIGGAGLWGMAISQISFSSLCDVVGMRNLLRLALLGHVVGVLLFVFATGFTSLFAGALVIAVANGMIEAVCNPLTATLFPDRKAGMLNRMHMWFPGGIVLGGLACWGLDLVHADWRAKMLIVLIPALAYGVIFLREKFPPTEAAAAGHKLSDAFKAVATSPLLWMFLGLMAITMSLELGPNRWIPAVLQAGGLPGILVLVMINGVMAVTRANAHAILARVSPPVVLMTSTLVVGLGLLGLSFSVTPVQTVITALVFAIGIAIVWPTMMGFVAERAPRTGALGLGLMAAAGSLAVGIVTTPLLGQIADNHLPDALAKTSVVSVANETLAVVAPKSPQLIAAAQAVAAAPGALPPAATGDFLRRAAAGEAGPTVAARAQPLLDAGENHSGLLSFRYLVPFAFGVCLIFGLVVLSDRRAGGYAARVARARLTGAAE
ncbi:sugar MFS transporter [Phenylobacterium sp.]|uniref:MFS transporter n=1 Tax=Phenylobacterium sp. TaxID=1871053 RepID=UPI00356A499F